jgi:hypothetical protein
MRRFNFILKHSTIKYLSYRKPVITFVFVTTCDVKHIVHIKQFSISSMHRLDRTKKLDTCNEMIWPCQSSLFHKNPCKHNIHSSNCHNFILSMYLLLDTLRNFGERWECNRANDRHYSTFTKVCTENRFWNNDAPTSRSIVQTKLIIHFVYMSKSCTPPPKYKNKIEN